MGGDLIGVVDRAIDRLDNALRAAGFDGLAPAADAASSDELEGAIAPYSLPQSLRRFWKRIEFSSLRVRSHSLPDPCGPRSSLETLRLNLDPELFPLFYGPPQLLPIARMSGDQWSIELVSARSAGGIVFSHGDNAFRIEYPSFTDLLEVYAELVEERRFVRRDNGFGSLNREDEHEKQQARLSATLPHPLYGDAPEIGREPAAWPAHWLESAGIDLRDRQAVGTTHTIAELTKAAGRGPIRARISGEVIRLVGSGGGALVIVTDGTRSLDIWCPAGTSPWGPTMGRRFEFEVTVEQPLPQPPDVDTEHRELQEHALAGRIGSASAAAEAMFGRLERHRPAAVASDIRPLD